MESPPTLPGTPMDGCGWNMDGDVPSMPLMFTLPPPFIASPVLRLILRCAPPGNMPVCCCPRDEGNGLLGLTERPVYWGCADSPPFGMPIGAVVLMGEAY